MDPVVFFWLLALTALPRVQSGTNTEWGTVMDMVGCTGMPADGTKDQTAELQLCINQCLRNTTCSGMMFPAGRYLLQRGPLVFNNDLRPAGASPMTIRGQGRSTVFVWASTANLIEFSGKPGPTEAAWSRLTLDGMAVESMVSAAPDNLSCAINFTAGVTQSLLSNIIIAPGNPNVSPGGGIDLGPLTDTVTLDNCVMYIGGTGVRIGRGSEVRIKGGRISGVASVAALTGVGVHVTGNNGGVHVIGTDVIGHRIGVLLDDSSGAGSNREIFLSQATLDSNYQGLVVLDDSYVDINGCWTASSAADNIFVAQGHSALLAISGGTIFNGGHSPGDNSTGNGMRILSGSFAMSGVVVRNNVGVGLHVADTSGFTVAGCKFYGNQAGGLQVVGDSGSFAVTGNVFSENGPNSVAGNHAIVENNVGCCSN